MKPNFAVFPGQGAQAVGMGKSLHDNYAEARDVFAEASEALGEDVAALCFEGPAEALNLTANTQPALLTTSIAAWRVTAARVELDLAFAAGHSLGEWSAWVAAEAISLTDAVRLVRIRGESMQEAVPVGEGAMAALIGMEADSVAALCADMSEQAGAPCEVANYNGGGQVVISGAARAIELAVSAAKERGAKRAIPLKVSAPFHSSMMMPAQEVMERELAAIEISAPRFPVVANVTAQPTTSPESIRDQLTKQVSSSVKWDQSVQYIAAHGGVAGIEFGPGKVLAGLIRRIETSLTISSIGDADAVTIFLEEWK